MLLAFLNLCKHKKRPAPSEHIQEEENQTPLPPPPSPTTEPSIGVHKEVRRTEYQQEHKPAPTYDRIACVSDTEADHPGTRCGHTLITVPDFRDEDSPNYVGPRLLLFGGATSIEDGAQTAGPQSICGGARIRLTGLTNDVHCYNIFSNKWSRLHPDGKPPSPRTAHATTAIGTMVVIQGGIGLERHATEDLYILDFAPLTPQWYRVVVKGPGPGPRHGHVMALTQHRYLVCVGGNDGKKCLSDAWSLDTATKPYKWEKLEPEGDTLPSCMYATASVRADGFLVLCGGRDGSEMPLDGAYSLFKHRDGRWEWVSANTVPPSPRHQHAAVFVDLRLHVTGGALREGTMVVGPASNAVFDSNARVWLDPNGVVTTPRLSRPSQDTGVVELTRRCRHAAAAVGNKVYIYGGLRGGIILDDLLVAEDVSSFEGFRTS